jgi:hypothetical protein
LAEENGSSSDGFSTGQDARLNGRQDVCHYDGNGTSVLSPGRDF